MNINNTSLKWETGVDIGDVFSYYFYSNGDRGVLGVSDAGNTVLFRDGNTLQIVQKDGTELGTLLIDPEKNEVSFEKESGIITITLSDRKVNFISRKEFSFLVAQWERLFGKKEKKRLCWDPPVSKNLIDFFHGVDDILLPESIN